MENNKHMVEASLYKKSEGDVVQCAACNHRCVIANGKFGVCNVRKNVGGRLFSLVYAKVIAEHVDPIEKKPLNQFYPGSSILSFGFSYEYKAWWRYIHIEWVRNH